MGASEFLFVEVAILVVTVVLLVIYHIVDKKDKEK